MPGRITCRLVFSFHAEGGVSSLYAKMTRFRLPLKKRLFLTLRHHTHPSLCSFFSSSSDMLRDTSTR